MERAYLYTFNLRPASTGKAHVNINSLRNKFDMLTNIEYIDTLMISETKLDDMPDII